MAKLSKLRILGLLGALGVSIVVGFTRSHLISGNDAAIGTIVTIFSILAGFLIGTITLISEPALSGVKDWKKIKEIQSRVRKKLIRQKILFYLYLISIFLALAVTLLQRETAVDITILEQVFLSLTVFIFLLSFSIPASLLKIQSQRFDLLYEELAPPPLKKENLKKPKA